MSSYSVSSRITNPSFFNYFSSILGTALSPKVTSELFSVTSLEAFLDLDMDLDRSNKLILAFDEGAILVYNVLILFPWIWSLFLDTLLSWDFLLLFGDSEKS